MNIIPPRHRYWYRGLWAIAVGAQATLAPTAAAGATVIHLTAAQQKTLNIQTAPLQTAAVRPMLTLYGRLKRNPDAVFTLASPLAGVVRAWPPQPWPQIGLAVTQGQLLAGVKPVVSTTLRITLALELTKVQADLIAAKVARSTAAAAYAREKSLYHQNEAVSLRRLQQAQAAWAAARSRVKADAQSIAAITRQLKAGAAGAMLPLPVFQTGLVTAVLAHPGQAVAANQPILKVENFQTLLAAVALPASESGRVAMAKPIQVRALGHQHWLLARRVAIGPVADRQTRGLSILYLLHNSGTLRPQMAITARVPKIAPAVRRTIIPRSAVVWWRGRRWVYFQRAQGVFVLRELIHPLAVPGGFAVRPGTLPKRPIVVKAAQLLMTIQLQSTLKKSG